MCSQERLSFQHFWLLADLGRCPDNPRDAPAPLLCAMQRGKRAVFEAKLVVEHSEQDMIDGEGLAHEREEDAWHRLRN